ncbi:MULTISPECIES: serine dehydratase subunit alpha family protein [Megasphaera]|uniref:UPF0597 protein HMPREF1250_1553 n=1 Tax=Megasphaera vaginalis (ex Srinivasan et al. 2021) TaxID=1111454 RepID=U7UAT0_9FIRM|nr:MULTISPECIES: L-serine ammonia-lyase, iron-sulfur-dependent, subunit alpha [Megasphaera]ERT56450.1 serine dehydratase alpha chain [Megasphaera vaginalis (ex Srinivasan et al. 2021)]
MDTKIKNLLEILNKEVSPALGCTGPTSVSLAAAKAYDVIGGEIEKIHVLMDRDTYKNSISVGIPGTSHKGLDVAASLGAIAGNAKKGLEVLAGVTPSKEKDALDKIKEGKVIVDVAWNRTGMNLFIDATVYTNKGYGRAIIYGTHTNIVYLESNNKIIKGSIDAAEDSSYKLDAPISNYEINDFINFAKLIDINELGIVKKAIELNFALANAGLANKAGSGFGVGWGTFDQNNVVYKARTYVAAAGDARMCGENLPAMSCASSGNVGITSSVPVKVFGDFYEYSNDKIIRAVALSFLVTIFAKCHIGRLSPVCACSIAASLGVAAGCGFLCDLENIQIEHAISNIIGAIGGTLCDGAKNGCAIKLSTSIGVAIENVMLVKSGAYINNDEGLVGENANESLALLGKIAREGMVSADIKMCEEIIKRNKLRR